MEIELKLLAYIFFLKIVFFWIYENNNWCRWLLSGFPGDILLIKIFLIIENKFSKQGYHNNKIIKKDDIPSLLWILININPKILEIKYAPLSPRYKKLKKFNIKRIVKKYKRYFNWSASTPISVKLKSRFNNIKIIVI